MHVIKSEDSRMVPVPDAHRIEGLFDHSVVAATERVPPVAVPIFSEEWDHVARAMPKRQAEFLTARSCARRALGQLGYPATSLVPNLDRSPTWPEGVTGTISHAGGCCAVVIAQSPPVRSLGFDMELGNTLPGDLERLVCTLDERSYLDSAIATTTRGLLAKILFSTKEAVYKCQYPISGVMLNFHDVGVRLDLARNGFRAQILLPRATEHLGFCVLDGRFTIENDLILSGCAVS